MNKAHKRIAEQITTLTGVDMFANSRNRACVEARALYAHILRNYFKLNLRKICKIFIKNKKTMHHATVLHLLKSYPIYKKYNECLRTWENEIMCEGEWADINVKKEYIKDKINIMPNGVVHDVYLTINNEFSNIIDKKL